MLPTKKKVQELVQALCKNHNTTEWNFTQYGLVQGFCQLYVLVNDYFMLIMLSQYDLRRTLLHLAKSINALIII